MSGLLVWLRDLFRGKEAPARPHGQKSRFEESNDFALALYRQLRQRPGKVFFSPFSIRAALGMAYAGARGDTAAQMSEALRFSSSNEAMHVLFAEIMQRLNAARGEWCEMNVANALWGQDGAPLQAGFLEVLARHYGGGMNLVDFRRDADAATGTINHWVEEKTRQRMRELIPPGSLDADTRLVLVNVVHFNGTWSLQFDKEATWDQPFRLEGGGSVHAPLMHQQANIRYMSARGYRAVDLDYRGCGLSMLVMLPDKKDGLRDFEKRLSTGMLHDCVAQLRDREVDLFLPRFKITSGTVDLRDQLEALGMPLAFTRFQADFSGINGQEPPHQESLFVSAVFHKAFVETNEEGTEAAAATEVHMLPAAAGGFRPLPVPIFRADHPFLFAIRDRNGGTLLFLGRMVDPTRDS